MVWGLFLIGMVKNKIINDTFYIDCFLSKIPDLSFSVYKMY